MERGVKHVIVIKMELKVISVMHKPENVYVKMDLLGNNSLNCFNNCIMLKLLQFKV